MYHPTEMANALTPTSWLYSLYLHTPERYNDNDHPSRLEISFLLDRGASFSVLNYPTYLTIAKLLNITCNTKTNHTSKTLTVANQTEVPILHYITTTFNTSIEQTSRQFIIPFAVADIKYNILGIPFFEEYIQNINIQDFTSQFKYQSKDQPNTTNITSLLSKDYPYFSYIYGINSKTQLRLNPNSSKIAHFPIRNTTIFTLLQLQKKTKSFLQNHIHTSHPIFIQPSISLKFSLMTNLIFVLQLFKTLQIILQHFQKDILVTLKYL